jgi:hypothetical protein
MCQPVLCHTPVSSFSLDCCLGAACVSLFVSHPCVFIQPCLLPGCSVPAFLRDQPCVLSCHTCPTHFCVPVFHHPSRHRRSAARALAAAARRTVCLPGVAGGAAGLVPQQRTRRARPGGATLASRAMEALLGLATGGGWAQRRGCRRQQAGPAAPFRSSSSFFFHSSPPPFPTLFLPMSVGVHHLHPMSPAHLSPLVFSLTHAAPSLPVSVPHATCTPPGSGMPLYLLPPHVSCMLCPAYTHLAHSGLPHQVVVSLHLTAPGACPIRLPSPLHLTTAAASPSGPAPHPTQPVTCSIQLLLQGFCPLRCFGVPISKV